MADRVSAVQQEDFEKVRDHRNAPRRNKFLADKLSGARRQNV